MSNGAQWIIIKRFLYMINISKQLHTMNLPDIKLNLKYSTASLPLLPHWTAVEIKRNCQLPQCAV